MKEELENEIRELAHKQLDRSEEIWDHVREYFVIANEQRNFSQKEAREIETPIPGYPSIDPQELPSVDKFIALVADMRDSTEHLMCAMSIKKSPVSQLQRIFYETSALLPCLATAIKSENGSVTEYLGDGVLSFFQVDEDNQSKAIYAAHRAAKKCLEVKDVVNEVIDARYKLPPLKIGVGMACSKAVITTIGLPGFILPKAFGECVFHATKLSGGNNEILIDETLRLMWPKSDNGQLAFRDRTIKGVDGYLIDRSKK